jgi:hypothetical protein
VVDRKKCPKCNNPMHLKDGKYVCSVCSCEIMTRQSKRDYFEAEKENILDDIKTIGRPKTCTKWGISCSTLAGLIKRWGIASTRLRKSPAVSPTNHATPPLPPFNDNWAPEVQLAWLEAWQTAQKAR